MVAVSGGMYRLVGWSRPTDERFRLDDFYIDKYEVSNDDYRAFITAGGYLKKDFWHHPFVKNGREISWDEAMKMFVDRSGLPGPRSWIDQRGPEGKGAHPVTDVSWYEAAAYAAFRGKVLPTAFQWEKAARDGAQLGPVNFMPWGAFYPGDTLAHHANFEAAGTVPVTAHEFGMSPFGAYNMAGNAAEWTGSDTSVGRIATGGAWGEPTYVFAQYPAARLLQLEQGRLPLRHQRPGHQGRSRRRANRNHARNPDLYAEQRRRFREVACRVRLRRRRAARCEDRRRRRDAGVAP